MNSRRLLRENIAALTALQLFSYVGPLLTVPYLVRVLKPTEFGLLSFAQGVVLYFDLLTDYGFNFSATRAIAAERHNSESVSRIFWSTLSAKVILMFFSAGVLSVLVFLVPKLREQPMLYGASFLYVIGTAFFPVWLFQGLEQIKIAALSMGIARMLTVPALLILVHSERDCVLAAAIQASVQVTATLLVLPMLWKKMQLHWYQPSLADIMQTFKAGWPLFISGCALYLSTSSTTVVLGFSAGKAEVGYYSAADKLIKAATSMLSPMTQALYPHITALKNASRSSALALIRKSLLSTGALAFLTSLASLTLARPICHLFLGASFNPSIHVLQWLSPLPLLFGLMSVFGTQTMLVFEMDSAMSRIMLASAIAGVPLTLALARPFGARGAAAGAAVLAFSMLMAMIVTLRYRGLAVWQLHISEASSG